MISLLSFGLCFVARLLELGLDWQVVGFTFWTCVVEPFGVRIESEQETFGKCWLGKLSN